MTHFGLLCPALPGHLNPMMSLGRELKQRGHRVTFFQVLDVKEKIISEELNFIPIGEKDYPLGTLPRFLSNLGNLSGPPAIVYWHEDHQKIAEIVCQEAPELIIKTGVEALIIDQLEPGGGAVAEYLKLPWITICNAMALNREPGIPPIFTHFTYRKQWWSYLRNQILYYVGDRSVISYHQVIAKYREKWQLPKLKGSELFFANSPFAQISQQPSFFDFPRQHLPKQFHYTGTFRNKSRQKVSFPFELLNGKPLIYASLGTLQTSKYDVFHTIAEACLNLDVQLIITHGGGMTPEQERQLPGSPIVVSYAPQLEVLVHCQLAITHAGLNTVLDALSCGVPLIAIPITFEQPGIASRVEWVGAGEVIPIAKLTLARLRKTIKELLNNNRYMENTQKLKNAMAETNGVLEAVNIIEEVVKFKKNTDFS